MKKLLAIALLFFNAAGFCADVKFKQLDDKKNTLLIADFDSWAEINNLGGKFNAWSGNPADERQGCKVAITDSERVGTKGNSVRLMYNVDSPKAAFVGMSMNVMNTDWTQYKYLVLSVKGDAEAGFTPRFKVELKNKKGESGVYIITGLTNEWQQIGIPVNEFMGITRFEQVKEISFVFDDMRCNPLVGVVYLDNVYLSK